MNRGRCGFCVGILGAMCVAALWAVVSADPAAGRPTTRKRDDPFALLSAIQADQLEAQFKITLGTDTREKGARHFVLTPRRPAPRQYAHIDLWIGRRSRLPVKIRFAPITGKGRTHSLKHGDAAGRPAAERDAALQRFEERGRTINAVRADFVQHIYAPAFDDHDTRTGRLMLLKPTYLRLVWNKPHNEEICYNGRFFWEVKHATKQVIKWTVARRREIVQGKPQIDAGPFKLLAGAKAGELKTDFLIALIDTPKAAPTDQFLLLPLRDRDRAEFVRLDAWIDRASLLPRRIRFTKPNREVETWTLKNLNVNPTTGTGGTTKPAITPGDFDVKTPRGYRELVDPA